MQKKIVAVGGGEYPRTKSDGSVLPYEIRKIHEEIISLSDKEKPSILILNHALENDEWEKSGNEGLKKAFEENFSCTCKSLLKEELDNEEKVSELLKWADIIYENGGDTEFLIDLWQKTNFYKKLIDAYAQGKVLSGVSAGAICWFNSGNTDKYKDKEIKGFDLVNAYFCPHYNKPEKEDSVKRCLKHLDKVGISLTDGCAIEIIDDKYRLIVDDEFIDSPHGIRSYWIDEEYIQENIGDSLEFKPLISLTSIYKHKSNKKDL